MTKFHLALRHDDAIRPKDLKLSDLRLALLANWTEAQIRANGRSGNPVFEVEEVRINHGGALEAFFQLGLFDRYGPFVDDMDHLVLQAFRMGLEYAVAHPKAVQLLRQNEAVDL